MDLSYALSIFRRIFRDENYNEEIARRNLAGGLVAAFWVREHERPKGR
jgi:hypothetical protein